MPRISEFYGIAIYLYYQDHAPPHFHAIYGEHEATISISSGRVLDGRLPRRALGLVRTWTGLHREELERDWNLARQGQPLRPIKALD